MDFDWIDVPFELRKIAPKEIEESFEDPFSIRLFPENAEAPEHARYFNLGRSVSERGIFTLFWTDGKRYRAICAREMTAEELSFYERKNLELGY